MYAAISDFTGMYAEGFCYWSTGMGFQILIPNYLKTKSLNVILNEVSRNTMSNINMYIIIAFSIVNNPYPWHLYMFITGNYSSKFTIMSFCAPALKSPAENGIPKNFWIRNCFNNTHKWISSWKQGLLKDCFAEPVSKVEAMNRCFTK